MMMAYENLRGQPTSTPNLSKFLSMTPRLMCTVPVASVLSLCRSQLLWMMESFLSSGPPPRKNARRKKGDYCQSLSHFPVVHNLVRDRISIDFYSPVYTRPLTYCAR